MTGTGTAVPGPAGSGATPADLEALLGHVAEADRHLAAAVTLAGRLAGAGVCERVEGVPLEIFLGLAGRMSGADRRTLVSAGEVLADMPAVAGLFADGVVGWGVVRQVVGAARRLSKAQRAVLDERVAATVDRYGLDVLAGVDPDQLVEAVDATVAGLRDPRSRERSEVRQRQGSFVSVQSDFDGGMRLYGELDAVTAAPVIQALDAAAGAPSPAGEACDDEAAGDKPAEGDPPVWSGSSRSRQYAVALSRIAVDWLGGDSGRAARPSMVVSVDLSQVETHPDGTVQLNVRGRLPRICTATLESLVRDADVRAVLFDGARPLAVGRKVLTADIPAATRSAVIARDRGCRFPGSSDPVGHTDVHHAVERHRGGSHDPDNLVLLSRRHHTLVHRAGWQLSVDPTSGVVTAARGNRRWRSLPRGTLLAPPRSDPDPLDPHQTDRHQTDPAHNGLPF